MTRVLFSNEQRNVNFPSTIGCNVKDIVLEILYGENVDADELSIVFVDKKNIACIHEKLFGEDSPTDCISLPIGGVGNGGYNVLGEVWVCPEVAKEFVANNGGNLAEEVTLYIIHGLLHLIGYDDCDESRKFIMKKAENKYMSIVKSKKLIVEILL